LTIGAGASAENIAVLHYGVIVDGGLLTYSGANKITLQGSLSGAGKIIEAGGGGFDQAGNAAHFTGEVVISGGMVELAAASGLGGGTVDFADTAAKKVLRIDAAAQPAAGGAFATPLIDFDSSSATYIDLSSQAFVSGATATLSGHTLRLHDGAYAATFTLSGTAASKYAVFSDGAGGTLIRAAVGSTQTPLLAHAMAAFSAVHGAAVGTSAHSAATTSILTEMLAPR
jgi:hypothetical protein